ncbi:MAG: PSD1 and planctomycete cytochrome C domain-containing protein [Planctomycetia bacterium]|nr:PSD1 and planctomycete cytochrome C domain-containing protein [Planctomycetia bacterium]
MAACHAPTWASSSADAPAALDFNRDIRPILSENCFYCHGQDGQKREADLRLDDRAAAIEARAIVPGDPGASMVLERIHSTDPDVLMPPPDSNRRLSEAQKKLLDRWIKEGAEYKQHWAFTAPVRPAAPAVQQAGWPRNEIDSFVLAKIEAAGLKPSPEADRAALIRRVHADLVGLPPTPEEVDAFVADPDPAAYEKLVDRLLASPHYGERMALPWLDAARYADSNGFQQDGDTWQWMWRDWVVKALNADRPFDRFSIEQLAGDLLPSATVEQKIASGFNRNHLLNGEGGAIPEEQRFNNLFDRVDTTSTTWLGLTMACAQCHDHKYDPMTRTDYYGMLDAFNRVPESGTPTQFSARIRAANPVLELPTEENKKRLAELEAAMKAVDAESKPVLEAVYDAWKIGLFADGKPADGEELPRTLPPLLLKSEAERTDAEKKEIERELRQFFDAKVKNKLIKNLPQVTKYDAAKRAYDDYKGDQIPRVMVMSDDKPRDTKILDRGDYLSPIGEKLVFLPPAFLPSLPEGAARNRLGLATWLFLPEHPLTARVQVNRMWQQFFGTGLVKTTEDMGVQSEYPRHMDLLDWLAVEFRDRGWSQKQMHRLLVTSATYRQASKVTPEHLAKDPENRLHARAARFRMPSMVLRDVALSASGLIDLRIGGQPVYPYQPDQIWEALAITKERDFNYPASHGPDLYRRSLYTFWRRTVSPANMFDTANRQTCTVRASQTSTPLHALTTLNDPTWVEAARVLAEKSMKFAGDLDGRLTHAFRRVLGRRLTAYDLDALKRMHARQLEIYGSDIDAAKQLLAVGESPCDKSLDPTGHAALTSVCLAIFNLDEALTRE